MLVTKAPLRRGFFDGHDADAQVGLIGRSDEAGMAVPRAALAQVFLPSGVIDGHCIRFFASCLKCSSRSVDHAARSKS